MDKPFDGQVRLHMQIGDFWVLDEELPFQQAIYKVNEISEATLLNDGGVTITITPIEKKKDDEKANS